MNMPIIRTYGNNRNWASCPDDILLLVFRKLDVKSLINCMEVNKVWRNLLDYYCEHVNLWKTMIKHHLENEGITFTEKSKLEYREQFYSAQRWLNIKNVTTCLRCQHKFDCIRNICVHKDQLIIVTNKAVNYFDINNFELMKTIEISCLNYEETSSLIVELLPHPVVLEENILTLTNKLNLQYTSTFNGETMKKIILLDVCLIKVHLNSCYIIDNKNVLWVYTANRSYWDSTALAKYYGNRNSMCSIHIYRENVYVLLKTGNVLLVDKEFKKFEKIFHFGEVFGHTNIFMFHIFSIILKVPKDKCINIYSHKEKEIIAMASPGVTCVLEHGHVLLLGYDDGKIEIYVIQKLLDRSTTPELEMYLQNFVTETLPSYKITAIDVYEESEAHRLFVTTLSNMYELLLYY